MSEKLSKVLDEVWRFYESDKLTLIEFFRKGSLLERKKEANEMEKELNLKRESIEQIRQLIEAQTEPSEEWIEEKAREIHDTVYSGHACNYECSLMMKCQDFIRTIVKDCRPKVSREKIFVEHIEQHLKDLKIKGKVLCKICGKDIDTIAQEAGAEE